jgi:CRP/FNR family transcriptional regulator, cyclic AMP receptor protein
MLAGLAAVDRDVVLAACSRRRWRKGQTVFHEDDPGDTLHLVARGRFAVRASTSLGDVATFAVLGPGETFGELALLDADQRRTATVDALEAGETLALRRDAFERLRAAHPVVERVLVAVLADQVRRLSERLVEALWTPADQRVLRRLLELADRYGDDGSAGAVTVPLTQDVLASMAGTTRPTANRALRAAEEAGLVRMGRGRIEVVDAAGLARRAR